MAKLAPDILQRRLHRALAVGGNTHGVEDISRAVADGRMQAWMNGDSLVITEVMQFPKTAALNVVVAVGNLDEVMALQPSLEAFGRQHGCKAMRMEGRRGWSKVLPKHGWKADPKVIYERAL